MNAQKVHHEYQSASNWDFIFDIEKQKVNLIKVLL